MQEINADMVRAAMADADPMLEALSILLKSIAQESVAALAGTLSMIGQNPREMPGEFFVQAMLVEGEKVFKSITRERWIAIYDSYTRIKSLVDGDPELKAELVAHKAGTEDRLERALSEKPKATASVESLLDGQF